jgi:3-dehydrotetronate 4-kinase
MTFLGCIADDFTGGTDVAAALRRSGLSVVLHFGVPDPGTEAPESDAVVIALKSRTVPAEDAVAESLQALAWLRSQGTERAYFKYCSTFDSTDGGNIGPVTEAFLAATGSPITLVCPASPEHGRTTYQGHLFVGDQLLSESSMRTHPLTPMTDSNLVAVMERQSTRPVGLLALGTIRAGGVAIHERLKDLEASGVAHVVVDAIEADDLVAVAEVVEMLPLLTGGAGLAGALGTVLAATSQHTPSSLDLDFAPPAGPGLVLAGSCSRATLGQVARASEVFPSYRLDPAATPDPAVMLDRARSWLREHWGSGPLVMYSSATPAEQEAARAAMGPLTSAILEEQLGELARDASGLGAARIVVAGGETSGAVVQALGYRSVVVLGEEDRGVPWCAPVDAPGAVLLLKSGNFGTEDLLVRAMRGAS